VIVDVPGVVHTDASRAVVRAALAFATMPGVRVTAFKLTRREFIAIAWAYGCTTVNEHTPPDDFRLLGRPVRLVEGR
jgi:hypothetical protein